MNITESTTAFQNCETEYGLNPEDVRDIVDKIYKGFERERQQLNQQIAYWKLSFNKQCKASKQNVK